MKKDFILNEIWVLTIGAAFQRASIYNDNVTNDDKQRFKTKLRRHLVDLLQSYTLYPIDEETHIKNIYSISNYSSDFSTILNNGKLNFGVSQKLLNLFLKYFWCLDLLKFPPPHFPVDRIIQQELGLVPVPWTQMESETDYIRIIDVAKEKLSGFSFDNIAELELALFSRR